MMKYLKREKHPIPWCVASSKLMYIYTLLNDGRIFSKAFRVKEQLISFLYFFKYLRFYLGPTRPCCFVELWNEVILSFR